MLINGLIVGLLVMSIIFIKKGNAPKARLNLRGGSNRVPVDPSKAGSHGNQFSATGNEERSLNVLFQHDNEWFDAYEVLEIPAGATGSVIDEQFQKLRNKADRAHAEIIMLAYENLKKNGRV